MTKNKQQIIQEFRDKFFRIGGDVPMNSVDEEIGRRIASAMISFLKEYL